MPFGAEIGVDGRVRFRLWAPSHADVHVDLDGSREAMRNVGDGWHELVTNRAHAGAHYSFVLSDGLRVPDPASRHQPEDVHGPSEVVDPAAYAWRDTAWRGRPWEEAVVYELHVGTFTPAGTFRAAIEKLDHLVTLGVTAIEIMPISDFPGRRNWGYDGVLPFAPDSSYGRPDDFKALIDEAHARGLMVLLDVVYNHFGPEGAYVHALAPEFFTERHKTPWGSAINMDGANAALVRDFFIHNALYWIEEFHLDGLRLDAVHAIADESPKHVLEDLAERLRASAPGRHLHLVLENEENQASRLARHFDGSPRFYTAQWNDDVHHVLHVAVTHESSGYYADYKDDTEKLGRALAEGFAFQGEVMTYRGGPRGEPSHTLPPAAFVAFIQNHDQIGNRAFGERLTSLASPQAVRAAAAVYLLLPQIPMLFMGEEWGTAQPFAFFCDFGPDLAEAVRTGRRDEFARFPEFQDPSMRQRIPDPMADETVRAAKLNWDDLSREPHAGWFDWYRRILAVRHAEIVPRLPGIRSGGRYRVLSGGAVVVRWKLQAQDRDLVLAVNLSTESVQAPQVAGAVLWREGEVNEDGVLGPFSVRWSLETRSRPARESDTGSLDRLAERMGIAPEFRDVHGRMVRTSPETQRLILRAMGVEAATDAQAADVLHEIEHAQWHRTLDSVQVVRAGEAAVVEITMAQNTGEIGWSLALEEGGDRSGRIEFASLELVDARHVDGHAMQRRRLVLGSDLPWGYHRLRLDGGTRDMLLVVTPGQCWLPSSGEQTRLWGIAAQLYLLRSANDWGIGDYSDLRQLVRLAGVHGADVIGLNPLHAMFMDDPEQASPYSPASRLLLNALNIDVTAVPEFSAPEVRNLVGEPGFQKRLQDCRAQPTVNYKEVTALKLAALEKMFEAFTSGGDESRRAAFNAFRRERGPVLEQNCLFLGLREHFAMRNAPDWHDWPEEYRRPDSPAVNRFARDHARRLDFLAWLQWIADEQLAASAAAAVEVGMSIGLYRDLAVGSSRAGAETWVDSAAVVSGAEVGAPPDVFNSAGQKWGLPPFHPRTLRDEAYRSFIELVRANMRHAGALRIDHVMALQQLYWVPEGQSATAGAYVRYPLDDLIGILALESQRARCLVIGEDLGTVPEGFRDKMAAARILSYRVLFFEQDGASGTFVPPESYPQLALSVVGSHDLPTLRGWWQERDIELKQELGLFAGQSEADGQREMRRREKAQLLEALRRQGLLPWDSDPDIASLMKAAHAFLARTPSVLAMMQIDDLTQELEPVNVPTTSDEYPNWRRRLSMTLDELAGDDRFAQMTAPFREARDRKTRE